MQIVIEIPDGQYEYLSKIADVGEEPLGYFERVIMRGTPLPKGHGRLIDADAVYDDFEKGEYDFEDAIEYASTIIPAERSDNE